MSSFTAIQALSLALKSLLEQHVTDTSHPVIGGVPVSLSSPRELRAEGGTNTLSLWLYQVERNAELLNQPQARTSPTQLERRPFPANLHYLVTPLSTSPAREQALLGRVVQVFHSQPFIDPASYVDAEELGGARQFRLTFQPLSLEELTRVWDALKEPYQLSVAYTAQLINIDSLNERELVVPVHEVETSLGISELESPT